MPASPRARLLTFAASALVLTSLAVTAAIATPAPKPGITVQTSPASRSVAQGDPASYTISVSSTGGLTGSVSLAATGLPRGASTVFTPGSLTLPSGGTASSALTVTTAATPVGSYPFTVTATSGKVTGSAGVQLTVNLRLSSSLSMSATPASITLGAGSAAVYAAQLGRTNLPAPITLAVLGQLPSGATATFSPNPAAGASSTLQVTTSATTPDGSYPLYLVASATDPGGHVQFAYASVALVVDTARVPFSISGTPAGPLAPGVSRPIDLLVSNPNNKPLAVINLAVTVQSVTRTAFAIAHNLPCGTADYSARQYSGSYPLTIATRGSATLSALGVAASAWPAVTMLDRATNQDGCKGATLGLAYAGSGQGN
ncbi:MAG: hypothetical protein ACRDWT_18530 [Jatrophihabitantaceae bacterium]